MDRCVSDDADKRRCLSPPRIFVCHARFLTRCRSKVLESRSPWRASDWNAGATCPLNAVNKLEWCLINNSKRGWKFSNGEEPDCSPPTSSWTHPSRYYFIFHHPALSVCLPVCPVLVSLSAAASCEVGSLVWTRRAVLSIVTCSGVILTCMAGLLLGSPLHLHRPLTASHLPPSLPRLTCL